MTTEPTPDAVAAARRLIAQANMAKARAKKKAKSSPKAAPVTAAPVAPPPSEPAVVLVDDPFLPPRTETVGVAPDDDGEFAFVDHALAKSLADGKGGNKPKFLYNDICAALKA